MASGAWVTEDSEGEGGMCKRRIMWRTSLGDSSVALVSVVDRVVEDAFSRRLGGGNTVAYKSSRGPMIWLKTKT